MSPVAHRAFRFRLAHPDETLLPGGLEIDAAGRFAMVAGDRSIRQAILLLLSTVPGERVGRPTYGCDLRSLAFAPNDDTTAGLAIHMVRQAVEEWEPRVRIARLDAVAAEDPGVLEIQLEYQVVETGVVEALAVPLPLQAGEV